MRKHLLKQPTPFLPLSYRESEEYAVYVAANLIQDKHYRFAQNFVTDFGKSFPNVPINYHQVKEFFATNAIASSSPFTCLSESYSSILKLARSLDSTIDHPTETWSVSYAKDPFFHVMKYQADFRDPEFRRVYLFTLFLKTPSVYGPFADRLKGISFEAESFPLDKLSKNPAVLKSLQADGFFTIGDCKKAGASKVFGYFLWDIETVMTRLGIYGQSSAQYVINLAEKIFANPRDIKDPKVVLERYGYCRGLQGLTLVEIGSHFNVTRERIRQIVVKFAKKHRQDLQMLISVLAEVVIPKMGGKGYLTLEDMTSLFSGQHNSELLAIGVEIADDEALRFDESGRFLYCPRTMNLDAIDTAVQERLHNVSKPEDLDGYDRVEKGFFLKNHHLVEGRYALKSENSSTIYGQIIDTFFPEGFRLSKDFPRFAEIAQDYFEADYVNGLSVRDVQIRLDRGNYCLIGAGTYKNRNNCVKLPNELVNRLVNYVEERHCTLTYQEIFNLFRQELTNLGVNNSYYLKGLLDPYLVDHGLKPERCYVRLDAHSNTTRSLIMETAAAQTGYFTVNDIARAVKGVEPYMIGQALADMPQILLCSSSRFLAYENANIDASVKVGLKAAVNESMALIPGQMINVWMLLEYLKNQHPEILLSNPSFADGSLLFSVLLYWFNNDFAFARPVIAPKGSTRFSSITILMNQIATMDEFNKDTLDDVCRRFNLDIVNAYGNFVEALSPTFIWVSRDKVVRAKTGLFPPEKLQALSLKIKSLLNKTGKIDTSEGINDSSWPRFSYPMNPFLLASLLRAYFPKDFKVTDTANRYVEKNFIIELA